jgi:RNA polymerase sigma factor (sigma-70 family)
MSSGDMLTGVVRQIKARLGDAAPDVELLGRYAQRRDEAAFAELVQRYGGLVLGVARRQLPDRQQAEDVFQATFLALARSAARLGRPASLANWLYTVALRGARKARLQAARRQAFVRTLASRPEPAVDPLAEISGRELLERIDAELARLPEKYRVPVLLCCVQGLSREEAARQLGWSDGKIKGRLERGRRRLAERLTRRGLAPEALGLAPLGAAAVPGDLLTRTASLGATPWSQSLPAAVAALAAAGASRKILAAALLASVLAAGLVGLAFAALQSKPMQADPPPPAPKAIAATESANDPLPAGSTLRLGTSRFRHGTAIASLTVSADDTMAVAASGNHWLGSTRAFDLTTGRMLYRFPGEGLGVEVAALSPDGRTLATRHYDNTLRLHDAATGQELRRIQLPNSNPRTITEWLTFAPDGKTLAVSPDGNTIALVDLERGVVARTLGPQHVIFAAVFSPDGKTIAAGGYDSEGNDYYFRLWEVSSGKEIRQFRGHKGGIRTLAFSPEKGPDTFSLASGGDDGVLRLWDPATAKLRRAFSADGNRIRSVAFSPDGRTVAAAGDSIRLYDPSTGQERLRIDRKANWLHFSADGRTVTAAVAGAIHRWDAASGKSLTPQGADGAVAQVLATADGSRIVTRDESNVAHVWDAVTGQHLRRFPVAYYKGIALSPNGRLLAWSAADPSVKFKDPEQFNAICEGSRLRLYDLALDRPLDRFAGFTGQADDLAFTPDGRTLVSVDHRDGTVRLWDVASAKEQRSFRAVRDAERRRGYFAGLSALSPDGRTLVVGYQRTDLSTAFFGDVVVRLWDVATGKERHELTGHVNDVLGLAFSPDSRLVATCGEHTGSGLGGGQSPINRVFLWDVATGQRLAQLPGGLPIGAGSVAFSPDGRTLATASADDVIRLWEVATWKVRAEFKGHRDRVSALAFLPDGRLLSGSLDTTVLAWDTRPPKVTGGSLAAAWDELRGTEAGPAFRAQGRLRAASAEAVALLRDRLKAVGAVDDQRLKDLIADLDSADFATRQKAAENLRQLGRLAEAVLRQAKEKAESVEVRRRAAELLAELEDAPTPPEELRALRAVEVLEWIGTAKARELLGELAHGAAGARLTQAAAAALQRLR